MPGTAVSDNLGSQVPHLNQIAPNFTSSNSFNINRARLMIRGNINRDISYFLAGEFGNNGFTHIGGNYTPAIMDGHATFSHYIPGVRIEAGIIRAPGPEQAMQGYMAYNFTSFANVTTQMMLQPFYNPNAPRPIQILREGLRYPVNTGKESMRSATRDSKPWTGFGTGPGSLPMGPWSETLVR
jgi:hypothetical protein